MKRTGLLMKKGSIQSFMLMIVVVLGLLFGTSMAYAVSVTHTFGGSAFKSAEVDDNGGYDTYFAFEIDSTYQIATGTLVLWDGTTPYDGADNNDFTGTGSGIVLFDPASGLGSVDEATGRATGPFLPTTFSAGPFGVEQYTFVSDSGQFAIYQWTVTNTSGSSVPAKLLFAIDWDLDSGSTDELTGFDATRSLVYQQDSPAAGGDADYTTGGQALISGTFDNYYQWFCCDITYDEANRISYMNGVLVGDMDDDSMSDKEVGVSADLGTLAPGESACVAIVQAVAQGTSAANGVANLQAEVDNAIALYATVPIDCSAVTNNPPSAPSLIYPADGQTGLGTTVEFKWRKSTDPDDDTVNYDLYYCTDQSFTGCSPITIDTASLWNKGIYYAGYSGAGLLLYGIVLAGGVRNRKRIGMLIAMIMIAGMLLVSCGDGNGENAADDVAYEASGFTTGTTYYWKVAADDSNGGITESTVWSFTTQ